MVRYEIRGYQIVDGTETRVTTTRGFGTATADIDFRDLCETGFYSRVTLVCPDEPEMERAWVKPPEPASAA